MPTSRRVCPSRSPISTPMPTIRTPDDGSMFRADLAATTVQLMDQAQSVMAEGAPIGTISFTRLVGTEAQSLVGSLRLGAGASWLPITRRTRKLPKQGSGR